MEETRFSNSFKQHIFRRRTNTKRVNSRDDEKHKWTGKNGKSEVIKLRASFPRRGGSISYRCIGIYIALQPCNFGLDVGKTRMRRRGNRVKEGESLCHELETLRQHPSTSRTFDTQLSLSLFLFLFPLFRSVPFPFCTRAANFDSRLLSQSHTPRYTLSSARSSSHTNAATLIFSAPPVRPARKKLLILHRQIGKLPLASLSRKTFS